MGWHVRSCADPENSIKGPENFFFIIFSHRGSYMSAHILLILLNELGKRDKM